jgi:hypothetical protein
MVSMTWRVLGRFWFHLLVTVLACAAPFEPILLSANQVPVRLTEGLMHGFLALRSLDGKRLADGEITQVAEGDRVTSRLIFRFKDDSVYDDTTIFSQRAAFRLLSDHLVERGPSFKQNMETSSKLLQGRSRSDIKDKDGREKVLKEQHELPPDVANGLLFTLVKHIQPTVPETTVSMVATTPKPRVVKLEILPEGKKSDRQWQYQTRNGALRREGKNRRCSWIGGAAPRETASRHARLGSHGQRPRIRQNGGSALRWRPDMAD